jgi:DNA recombination protein RmuC
LTVDLTTIISILAVLAAACLSVMLSAKHKAWKIALSELAGASVAQAELAQARVQLSSLETILQEAKVALTTKDAAIESKSNELRGMEGKLSTALAQVEAEKTNAQNLLEAKDAQILDQLKLIEEAKTQMKDVFAGTASETLRLALEDFDTRTKSDHLLREHKFNELIKPIGDGLERLSKRCENTDKVLTIVQSGFSEQVKSMLDASNGLSNALRRPNVRGSWGEMTMRNALDDAGLKEGIDFDLQDSQSTENGRLRADAVVFLPQGQRLVIDCKTPLETFREAVAEVDPVLQAELLKKHSQGVRKHIAALSSKDYQSQYEGVDFVLMFLPTEAMYQAAIEHDPGIVAYGHDRKVYIANPITLLGVLRATAHVMNLVRSNEEATNIRILGEDLYRSFGKFAGTYAKVGSKLVAVVKEYNESVASMEGNLLCKARKFKGLGVNGTDLPETVESIECTVRPLCKPELMEPVLECLGCGEI